MYTLFNNIYEKVADVQIELGTIVTGQLGVVNELGYELTSRDRHNPHMFDTEHRVHVIV